MMPMSFDEPWMTAVAGTATSPTLEETAGSFRSSPLAWAVVGALLLAALYLLIRLLEWDQVNRDAEDQDDPLRD
jgi:hypothetical protein